jgi:hypothetical protein
VAHRLGNTGLESLAKHIEPQKKQIAKREAQTTKAQRHEEKKQKKRDHELHEQSQKEKSLEPQISRITQIHSPFGKGG